MNRGRMRKPTREEREKLVRAIAGRMRGGSPREEDIHTARDVVGNASIVVYTDYFTDAPGYYGRILVALYGDVSDVETYVFSKGNEIILAGRGHEVTMPEFEWR